MRVLFTIPLLLVASLVAANPAFAKKTVCTVTVNSADEKDTMRARLPAGEYEFVELVEKGRKDWLQSSCQRNVQCDVLVISGHFNAGDTFYSDRLERNEYLEIDELERAACGASCPNLFSRLKEVYLFGCESLNPDSTRYASAYGESGRERMRRIFAGVPAIYGFSSAAPVGPTAGMLLNRYFDAGGRADFGSGHPSPRLLKAFSRNSMVAVPGTRPGEALHAERAQICRFFDERQDRAQLVHGILRGDDSQIRRRFHRMEKLVGPVGDAAFSAISDDAASRSRFLAVARKAEDPALRARMIAFADTLGWLSDSQLRDEQVAMINDTLAKPMGFAEVDLVCSLNKDGALDGEASRIAAPGGKAAHTAVRACLGSREAHAQMVRTLVSSDEKDVQVAQTYLRHRPMRAQELRPIARDIARATGPAQVRALDALARLHISDREILEDLSHAFADARTHETQRAIAEVFMRSDATALPRAGLADMLRRHRIKSPGGKPDLVDALLARLQAG